LPAPIDVFAIIAFFRFSLSLTLIFSFRHFDAAITLPPKLISLPSFQRYCFDCYYFLSR
jgi:hypothetical protein